MDAKQELRPGDLLWVDRSVKDLPYNHCGIYEGEGYVIHFASPEGSEINPENAVVHRASYEKFKYGCPVKVLDLEGSKSADETLRRARSLIGKKGYNLLTFNCDHFATWCKTGEYRSIQVDEVKAVLRKSIGGSITEMICTFHDIAEILTAPRMETPSRGNEIAEPIPPSPDKEKDIYIDDYEIIEEEPVIEDY